MTARLTLNHGLRWDYYIPQYDVHNEILGFFPRDTNPPCFPMLLREYSIRAIPERPIAPSSIPTTTTSPRAFGFAWDMLGNAKTRHAWRLRHLLRHRRRRAQPAVRRFAAISRGVANEYNSGPSFVGITGEIRSPIPFGTFGLRTSFPFLPSDVGTFGVPAISYGYTTYPHFRTPYSENFNYGFQWQATKNTMVEAVYVGSLGRKADLHRRNELSRSFRRQWNNSTPFWIRQ